MFVSGDLVRPVLVEGADVAETRLLHHAARGNVDRHCLRVDTVDAKLGEAFANQRNAALGRIASAPGRAAQPVAQLNPGLIVTARARTTRARTTRARAAGVRPEVE